MSVLSTPKLVVRKDFLPKRRVKAVLNQGLATVEHTKFAAELAKQNSR